MNVWAKVIILFHFQFQCTIEYFVADRRKIWTSLFRGGKFYKAAIAGKFRPLTMKCAIVICATNERQGRDPEHGIWLSLNIHSDWNDSCAGKPATRVSYRVTQERERGKGIPVDPSKLKPGISHICGQTEIIIKSSWDSSIADLSTMKAKYLSIGEQEHFLRYVGR